MIGLFKPLQPPRIKAGNAVLNAGVHAVRVNFFDKALGMPDWNWSLLIPSINPFLFFLDGI